MNIRLFRRPFFSIQFSLFLLFTLNSFSAYSERRPDILFDDFESGTYDKWTYEGNAFGRRPAKGTLSGQMTVKGYNGEYLVNTYYAGDNSTGKLSSDEFVIERNYINFLLGGGCHYRGSEEGETTINLYVDSVLIYSSTPDVSEEELKWSCWDVTQYQEKKAYIQIVDNVAGSWGHVNVDDIIQSDNLVIANFENGYSDWLIEGTAFGTAPATGKHEGQNDIYGFNGKYLVNSFLGGDTPIGKLISPDFTIEKDFINFRLGGGMDKEKLHIDLYVEDKLIYSSTPVNYIYRSSDADQERLRHRSWDVNKYKGKTARIEIVDKSSDGWGHINADDFIQCDRRSAYITDNYTVHKTVSKPYIQIPTQNGEPLVELIVKKNDEQIQKIRVRLAKDAVNQFLPLYLDEAFGEEITLSINEFNEHFADILEEIKFTESPEIELMEEYYRPDFHFAPAYGWMNDPNGMVYFNGKFHLFYQHYPYGTHWDKMHWGHAVSEDLIHWEYLPIALFPDHLGAMFSGSIVVDKDNTAGFGKNALIALYTSTEPRQAQSLAYSIDEGLSWKKYDGNPVLWSYDVWDFRDPKVFWHADSNQWIMSLATSQTITFYGSQDLKKWEKLSEFGKGIGAHGGVWECPDLFALKTPDGKTKWVLLVSINPGGPNGGSGTQYFIGDFDGKIFTADNLPYSLWIDYGKDNYAGVTWSNILTEKDEPVFIGWMSNWEYAGGVPTSHFKSANTFPRALSLVDTPDGLRLKSKPLEAINGIKGSTHSENIGAINTEWQSADIAVMKNGTYMIEMQLSAEKKSWKMILENDKGEFTAFGYDAAANEFYFDRQNSGIINFSNNFASGKHSALLHNNESANKLTVLVDKSSVELFVNDGRLTMTELVFPASPYNKVKINPENEVLNVNSFIVTELEGKSSTYIPKISAKNTENILTSYHDSTTDELVYNYTLSQKSDVSLRLISMTGKITKIEQKASLEAGTYYEKKLLKDVVPGIYVIQLLTENNQYSNKIVIAK